MSVNSVAFVLTVQPSLQKFSSSVAVPCANCDKTYIGETGRKFGVRL